MSYAKKRAKGKTPSEIYAEIRKEHTEKMLLTGERWMVLVRGIPDRQIDSKFAYELTDWLLSHATKAQIEEIRFKNMLTGDELTVSEIRRELKK